MRNALVVNSQTTKRVNHVEIHADVVVSVTIELANVLSLCAVQPVSDEQLMAFEHTVEAGAVLSR